MNEGKFFAHIRSSDEKQLLSDHLLEVGQLSAQFAKKIGLPQSGLCIGVLHDFGKYSSTFQAYLQSATGIINPDADEYVDHSKLKGKIDHSTAGAQYIWNKIAKKGKLGQGELVAQILCLCVVSHHSGLIDCLHMNGERSFDNRIRKNLEKTFHIECQNNADSVIKDSAENLLHDDLILEVMELVKKVIDLNSYAQYGASKIDTFNLGMVTKFLFSCLVDADRLNSAEFEDPERKKIRDATAGKWDWQVPIARLEAHLSKFQSNASVDRARKRISDLCYQSSSKDQGLYTLTVPTGGGKTLASLRFALHHAKKHNLERIVFIVPFTTVIEQNAAVIRNILENEADEFQWLLECHSNLDPHERSWRQKLVSENWDSPIVITTMVQYLEALFSGGTRCARRMHQLAKSVLVFDEIQSLPIRCVHMFCNSLNFLSAYAGTTGVLCTATQPILDRLKNPEKGQLNLNDDAELVKCDIHELQSLDRVDVIDKTVPIGWKEEEIGKFVISEFQQNGNCLVIVNTKKSAKEIYNICRPSVGNEEIFHLSTNMYPQHRFRVLMAMKSRLNQGLPVLCISTQLIEAGVDIDFSTVVRYTAGIDSIAQAAGRCNRNGVLKNSQGQFVKGKVYVLNPINDTSDFVKDLKVAKEIGERVLREMGPTHSLLDPIVLNKYFEYYFFNRADQMDYPISDEKNLRDDNLLNLLSNNPRNVGGTTETNSRLPRMQQSFMAAGEQFQVLDESTQGVIVPLEEGREIVTELCAVAKEFNAHRYYELLKSAQKFSVNVFPNVLQKLRDSMCLYEITEGEGVYFLDERFYHPDFGLSEERIGTFNDAII